MGCSEPECHHNSVLMGVEGWMFLCRVLMVLVGVEGWMDVSVQGVGGGRGMDVSLWGAGGCKGALVWGTCWAGLCFNWWWGKNLPVLSPHASPSTVAEGKTLLRPPGCAVSAPTLLLVLTARYIKGLVACWALGYVLGEVACSPETWLYEETYGYGEMLLPSCTVQFSGSEIAPDGCSHRWMACAGGWERRGFSHNPNCNALGFEMMTENFPARICSHLATACSPGCFSRRVWSVLAKESLLFPKCAYHFVLDNDGNFRHFFFRLEANMRKPAFAGSIVLVFLCAESRETDKVFPKYCWLCRC